MALTGGFDSGYETSDLFTWSGLIGAAALPLDGPVPAELKAVAFTSQAWRLSHLNTFLALGVVFNMTVKPAAAGCLGVLAVAAVLGSGLGQILCKRAAVKAG